MKKLLLLLFFLFHSFSFSQNNWQELMHNREVNFNLIQNDFNLYYSQNVTDSKIIPKGKGIKQFKRWEYYWGKRVDENGNFPTQGSVLNEIEKYRNSKSDGSNKYALGSGNWSIVGPIASPNNGSGQLNGNGRLNCITFHPTDPNIIYAGAPSGGFWKSTDNGATWTEYSSGLVRLGVSSIVINPSNPDIIYIGTGDRDAGDAPGYGVWRSTNGGLTWNPHNTGMGNRTVYEILINPSNSNNLFASTNGNRIYRSVDGGVNWILTTTSSNMKDIAFKPGDPNTIYASGTTFDVSTDNGVTFTQVTSGVPSGSQRIALAVSPNQPTWVYLLAGNVNGLIGIYRSIDSGLNFATRTTSPNILGWETNGSEIGSQAWYDLVIAADPTNADVIYTGGINLWKSVDGGTNMACISRWQGTFGSIDGVHADHHALEFSPHTNILYNGNDGGAYFTSDNGTNWNDISSGLAIAQVYKIGVAQNSENTIINGYQDNGTALFKNEIFSTEIGGDGMECIIDPTNSNYMYGALYYGDIRRSSNGGTTFSQISGSISETGDWVTPYKLDPNEPNRMFAGYDNIWRNDAVRTGNTWSQISSFGGTSDIVDLAIAPSNSNVMYVSRFGTNKFYSTTNALAATPTWTNITANLPINSTPKDIEIDLTDPNHLFIALGNDIYESSNAGLNWVNIAGTLPNISLNTIVIDPSSTVGAMYVGMDVGVYYKDSNLSNWVPYSTGLAKLEISELEIYNNSTDCNSKLYASTYGQGLWISDLKDPGNVAPKACFEASTTFGCTGVDFILTDNSDFTPTSWLWTITPATVVYVNGTSATSQNPQVRFTNPGFYTVELTATNANGSDTNTKISYIEVTSGTVATAFNEDFEGDALCAITADCGTTVCSLSGFWSNLTNGTNDTIDWRVDEGGTPSTGTGPSVDFNPGTTTGNYIYLESSSCFSQTAILESQCMIIDQGYDFKFAYHMYGATMGSLHVDVLVDGIWQEDIITAFSGNLGNAWNSATVDLLPYISKTIKIRLRGITGSSFTSDMALDDIQLIPKCSSTTTWNGSWDNGLPNITTPVVFAANYTATTDIASCNVTVNAGVTVTIPSGFNYTVQNDITLVPTSSFVFQNNANLFQNNDAAVNSGNIIMHRNSNPLKRLDYTIWSGPVTGQNLLAFSPLTLTNRFYTYNTATDLYNAVIPSSTSFTPGIGYQIRVPDNHPTTPTIWPGTFTGVPNNGSYTVGLSLAGNGYNMVGNPYPSPIDLTIFDAVNTANYDGTIYFWRKENSTTTTGVWSTWNKTTFVLATDPGTVGILNPNDIARNGQGFLLKALTTTLEFNNTMRVADNANQFFKNANTFEKNRIWLNLTNEAGYVSQQAISYSTGGTYDLDRLDAKNINNSAMLFTSTIPNSTDTYTIQSRQLPFNVNDIVPLHFKTNATGTYKIAIDHKDGLFEGNTQDIFIYDKYMNTYNNLNISSFVFNSDAGEYQDRFELRFASNILTTTSNTISNISVYQQNDNVIINSSKELLKSVLVFDIRGRLLLQKDKINANQVILELLTKNDVLLLKVLTENGQTVNLKIIN